MIDQQPGAQPSVQQGKMIPIQERSVRVGDVIVVNGYRAKRSSLTARFAEGGYQVHETRHFLLFTRTEEPKTILVHWFAPEEMTTSIPGHLAEELQPFGLVNSSQRLGEIFAGIVGGALFPGDVARAWNYFGTNTLQRLLAFVGSSTSPGVSEYGICAASAVLYQRVLELCVGERFLDAACNGGFLSLLLAERVPFACDVVGVDLDADVFRVAQDLAKEGHLSTVRYQQADLLADDFSTIGMFDTVTALHVLEHFTEAEMYRVLANLLQVTSHRLICAVPYEAEPSQAFDHKQLFTRQKLEAVGAWCFEQMQGKARLWYEDLPRQTGLLLLERLVS